MGSHVKSTQNLGIISEIRFYFWSNDTIAQQCFHENKQQRVLSWSPQSAGCSHSVRANVQSVLSLLKQHQPHLCNRRVLCIDAKSHDTGKHKRLDASSTSTGEEELSDLLRALREEMRLMSL